MNRQLLLEHIRDVLARLEETIIFALIERAQFCHNARIYEKNALGEAMEGHSLVGYLLRKTEEVHARMRRYTSPDEHPFCDDLPDPILPALSFSESPLQPVKINLNKRIRSIYEQDIVPGICAEGDDSQYGSSAVCDVACLQAISRRIHFGSFVAESKYRADPALFDAAVERDDPAALLELVTNDTEKQVIERVRRKARAYGCSEEGGRTEPMIDPDEVAGIYARWIIPMNKEVQVLYLQNRTSTQA